MEKTGLASRGVGTRVPKKNPLQDYNEYVMILGETYTDKPSAFDFAQCRDDVEIGMVVVFFKVRM